MPKPTPIRPAPPRIPATLARQVIWLPINALKAWDRNARTHSDRQVRQLAASMREFGFVEPVLIDESKRIIAGHGRIAAAGLIGLTEVPTLLAGKLSEAQKRALVIAHNRLAELAGWDRELLKIELGELVEIDYRVEITGFATGEIDLMLDTPPPKVSKDDQISPLSDSPAISRIGDLWLLGNHRLLCGNALEEASYAHLMGRERAQMVFTDPPYNVPIAGHVSGLGKVQHREFVMASGEMTAAAFTTFLQTAMTRMSEASQDGAIVYVCMDWAHSTEILTAAGPVFGPPKQLCVWDKQNAGMGAFYRSGHELVWIFKKAGAPHINNFGLGEHGRYRTNLWRYPGFSSLGPNRDKQLEMHPTVKPMALVADAIRDCSKRKGIVLDPFAGSGTTILAAERTGRMAWAMELDPKYVDVILRRWLEATGVDPVLKGTKETYTELVASRTASSGAKPLMTARTRKPCADAGSTS
jgi:DNA modification methylase